MDAGRHGRLPARRELFDVLLKGKQLEQTMKDRQAGGGAKSGRYKKHDTLDLVSARVVYQRLKMGILPSATDSKMLFDMPGVYQCLRAAWRAPRAPTSATARAATRLQRFTARAGAMDAGAMGACRRYDELFDVLLKGKQLEQTMKDRQAGGGAKSGHATADDERDAAG
ncbi:hypothetical protein SO694_00185011 [Aureococcus anophagefferens]|uniref:Uncharacterized protein n=1 Tax=Aureococcus anophagefferens TaxID=44056 RepID=A0ABR1FG69_AURAN